jgi:hypothetical protein
MSAWSKDMTACPKIPRKPYLVRIRPDEPMIAEFSDGMWELWLGGEAYGLYCRPTEWAEIPE